MIRRSSLIFFEVLVGMFVTVGLGFALAAWRLSQGPIELPPLKRHVETELASARGGRPIAIDTVELAWSGAEKGFELRARGVKVLGADLQVLTESRTVDIGLDPIKLMVGKIGIARAAFDGADITLAKAEDGSVGVSFGPPGSPPDIVIPPPALEETPYERVNRVLDGLAAAFRPVGVGGSLREIDIRNARLAIADASSGEIWRAADGQVLLTRDDAVLTLAASARLQGPRGLAPASLQIVSDTTFQGATIDLVARGVQPSALLMRGELGAASTLQAPVTAAITLGLDRKQGVTLLEGDLSVGEGVFRGLGGEIRVSSARVRGRYDIDSDTLTLHDIAVGGVETRINGDIAIRDASALFGAEAKPKARFEVSLPELGLAAKNVFAEPLALSQVAAVGEIDPKARTLTIESAGATVEKARVSVAGKLYWAPAEERIAAPGVALHGAVDGEVSTATVLRYWPVNAAPFTRGWLERSVISGRIRDISFKSDIKPRHLAEELIPDNALSVRFGFDGANVRYLDGMTPIANGRGSAELKGNRFDLVMESGTVGPLAVSAGRVELPRFKPQPGVATYAARMEGEAKAMVDLLMQAPIGLAERMPADPASLTGRGAVAFAIHRPMQAKVAPEAIRFSVDGEILGAGATLRDPRYKIVDSRLRVSGDERALTFSGPLKLADSRATLTWTEALRDGGATPSSYVIDGLFPAKDLVDLGYSLAAYAEGPIGVNVQGRGRGSEISVADVKLDFKGADVALPSNLWVKRPARAASASFQVRGAANGALAIADIDARGPGLAVTGGAGVDADRRLSTLNLQRVWIDGRTDMRFEARRDAQGILRVTGAGAMFDAAPFLGENTQQSPATRLAEATRTALKEGRPIAGAERWTADIAAEKLRLRGDADLMGVRISAGWDGPLMTQLVARGRTPAGAQVALDLGAPGFAEGGPISFRTDDFGLVYRGVTGADSVRAGRAAASGSWRTKGQRAEAVLKAEDFQVVGVPAMARLLSSVGSLTGTVEMLNGEGISFTGLEAPVTLADGKLYFADARAAGPSIGITVKGAVALADGSLDLDGVLVPSYGLNSMLGGVPLLGQLLTSRKGEGVVGMTYSISGPSASPRVAVNPLSALTPGIFRRIFEPWAPPQPPPDAQAGPAKG